MIRFAEKALDNWLQAANRKPVVLRGARQVGKTWLVRDLAKRNNLNLIELNLERHPPLADLFSGNTPRDTLKNIEAELNKPVPTDSSLLFLDEIQAAPQLFAKLRWFKEEMQSLPVIAAGSLLELAFDNPQYSMPVGRISYYYLEPLSFFEFLLATGHDALHKKLSQMSLGDQFPSSLHKKCQDLFFIYCLVGGMPEVVEAWRKKGDLDACIKIQQDLLATFRDDFHKYGGRAGARQLSRMLLAVAEQLGNKFVFSRVDPALSTEKSKQNLDLLSQARVCSKIYHSAANGIPLGAEINEKFMKLQLLDIGLVSVQLGLSSIKRSEAEKAVFSQKGALTEQYVGQQLKTLGTPLDDIQLYYWQRTGGRQGELDFIIQQGNRIIPVEVKAGASGRMKSLHQFMFDKGLNLAIRIYNDQLKLEHLDLKTTQGNAVAYHLLSIPHYLIERLPALLDEI